MNIQYVSDIHAEFHNKESDNRFFVEDGVDVVVVCGDTHHGGKQAAKWLNDHIPDNVPCLVVLGNHEYYSSRAKWGREQERFRRDAKSNIILLHDSAHVIDGVKFVGSTLWTDFKVSGNQPVAIAVAQRSMNDYKAIKRLNPSRPINAYDTLAANEKSVAFIKQEIKDVDGVVVVTHHDPLPPTEDQKGFGDHLAGAYHNDLRQLVLDNNIEAWFSGHSHYKKQEKVFDTLFCSNPHGYVINGIPLDPYQNETITL